MVQRCDETVKIAAGGDFGISELISESRQRPRIYKAFSAKRTAGFAAWSIFRKTVAVPERSDALFPLTLTLSRGEREQQLGALVGSEFAQPLTAMGWPCFESDQLGNMATAFLQTL
jgi:hypothetical protein